MTYSIFIDPEYFFRETGVDRNIDANIINHWIRKAQFVKIYSILGKDLYNKIDSDINSSALTGNYLILTNQYVAPVLANWAKYFLGVNQNYSITNKGVQEKRSEFSSPIDLNKQWDTNKELELGLRDLEVALLNYLDCNQDLFPEYVPSCGRYDSPYTDMFGLY